MANETETEISLQLTIWPKNTIDYSLRIIYNNVEVANVEKRTTKLILNTPGGTAAKGAVSYKVALPTVWVQQMLGGKESSEVELTFDGTSITVRSIETPEQFLQTRRKLQHKLKVYRYYDESSLCTTIYVDYTSREVSVINHTDNPIKQAFGNCEAVTWTDWEAFLESRCIPRQRAGLREYLESLGLSEYEPEQIVAKTKGKMAEDQQWLEGQIVI